VVPPQVGSARSDSTRFEKVNRRKPNRCKSRPYCTCTTSIIYELHRFGCVVETTSSPHVYLSFSILAIRPVSVLRPTPILSPSFLLAQAIFEPYLFPYKYPNISHSWFILLTSTCLWRWNRQSVLKCWHIKFRCLGNAQKKACNIQNMAKVWNQELATYLYIPCSLSRHVLGPKHPSS